MQLCNYHASDERDDPPRLRQSSAWPFRVALPLMVLWGDKGPRRHGNKPLRDHDFLLMTAAGRWWRDMRKWTFGRVFEVEWPGRPMNMYLPTRSIAGYIARTGSFSTRARTPKEATTSPWSERSPALHRETYRPRRCPHRVRDAMVPTPSKMTRSERRQKVEASLRRTGH